MKAEHRKELQTNILADALGRLLQGAKEGLSRSVLLIIGLFALVVMIYLGWLYFSRASMESRSAMWLKVDEGDRKLDTAANIGQIEEAVKELDETAKEKPETVSSRVMRFACARTQLRLGLGSLYAKDERDRKAAIQRVEQALDLYTKLANESQDTPVLHQEALLGMAQAQESQGQVAEALEGYQKLAQQYPDSAAGREALARVNYLQSSEKEKQVADFYQAMDKLANASARPR